MCLAIPVKVETREGEEAWGLLGDARIRLSLALTPEAGPGDWVLVHAGFAIERISEEEAKKTFEIVREMAAAEEEGA